MSLRIKKLIPLFLVLVLWELGGRTIDGFVFRFGSPSSIVGSFWLQLSDPRYIERYNIYYSFVVTFGATFLGFAIGNLFGSAFGLGLWLSDKVSQITKPYLIALGAIPIFSIAPMLILWFGTGFYSKVIMSTFSTFLVATVQSYEGATNVDPDYVNFLKSMGARRLQVFSKLILPASLIWVFASYRLNVSFAIIGTFVGEWISSEFGIGHLILAASGLYDTPLILVGLVCLILMAFILYGLLNLLEARLLKWRLVLIQKK